MTNIKNKLVKLIFFLLLAMQCNSSQSMKKFIKKTASELLKDCSWEIRSFGVNDKLLRACRLNYTEEAIKLIKKNTPINQNRLYYLLCACENNNTKLAKLLIKHKAPIHKHCIHHACANNNSKLVKLLCKKGIELNRVKTESKLLYVIDTKNNRKGSTMLFLLDLKHEEAWAKYGYKAKYTLKYIPVYKYTSKTPLYIAIERNYSKIIKILLAYGTDTDMYKSCLLCACKNNNTKLAKSLIKQQAPIHKKCLYHACKNDNLKLVKPLCKKRIKPNRAIDYQTNQTIKKIFLSSGHFYERDDFYEKIKKSTTLKKIMVINYLIYLKKHPDFDKKRTIKTNIIIRKLFNSIEPEEVISLFVNINNQFRYAANFFIKYYLSQNNKEHKILKKTILSKNKEKLFSKDIDMLSPKKFHTKLQKLTDMARKYNLKKQYKKLDNIGQVYNILTQHPLCKTCEIKRLKNKTRKLETKPKNKRLKKAISILKNKIKRTEQIEEKYLYLPHEIATKIIAYAGVSPFC